VENWKPVVGFEGLYEVSSLGRVRSVLPRKGARANVNGGIISGWVQSVNDGKYKRRLVSLRKNKKTHTMRLHHLVLEAFHGQRPDGSYGLHNNGDPLDDRATNLRWGSPADNTKDSVAHGTKTDPPTLGGEAHHKAKMSTSDVEAIRQIPYRRGLYQWIAQKYGVAPITASRIHKGQSRANG